jgi:GNAT superfamily N-acetyltransferase
LRPFSTEHLEGALALSREMSWPYRLEDWAVALAIGKGFALMRGSAVIGTAAWWPYGETGASAGMIIVSGAEQGRGYGARLMDAILDAASSRVIQLNSTAEGRLLYERRGFHAIGTVHQHQGILSGAELGPPPPSVRPAAPSDRPIIAALDHEATGWTRTAMLEHLSTAAEAWVLERGGVVRGYAMSRPFGRGRVIGPVIADDAADARALIEAALAALAGEFVRIDTASTTGLGDWFVALGLERVGDALTMVRGTPAPLPGPARRFALANQSFG